MLNPTLDQAIIDQALIDDPAAAKAEWLGEFRDDVGGWLPSEVIEAAVDVGITVRPPRKDFTICLFLRSQSGGARDSFTAAIAHIENDIAVLDCLVEIKAPFNPTEATATIAGVLAEYGFATRSAIAMPPPGSPTASHEVASTTVIQRPRPQHDLSDSMPSRCSTPVRVRLLDNRRMVTQFANLERRTSPIGKDRVDHGPGGHDDFCNSAAGALDPLTLQDWSIARRRLLEAISPREELAAQQLRRRLAAIRPARRRRWCASGPRALSNGSASKLASSFRTHRGQRSPAPAAPEHRRTKKFGNYFPATMKG